MTDSENDKRDKLIGNLIAGGYTILCGVVLLLVGLDVFGEGISMRNFALPSVLLTIGLVFITSGIIRRNCVSMWLAFVFVVPAVVTYSVNFTPATYAQLYPLYIAIPAVCSLFAMPLSRSVADHLIVIFFFGVMASLFALQSSGVADWRVVAPALVVFVGCCIVVMAIRLNKKGEDD